jgi:hypothetical protein
MPRLKSRAKNSSDSIRAGRPSARVLRKHVGGTDGAGTDSLLPLLSISPILRSRPSPVFSSRRRGTRTITRRLARWRAPARTAAGTAKRTPGNAPLRTGRSGCWTRSTRRFGWAQWWTGWKTAPGPAKGLVSHFADGVGSRFRASTVPCGQSSPENDSRPPPARRPPIEIRHLFLCRSLRL